MTNEKITIQEMPIEKLTTEEIIALREQLDADVEEAGTALEYALDKYLYSGIPFDYSKEQELFELEAILDQFAESFDVAEKYYLDFEEELRKRVSQRRQNSNGSSTQQ